MRPGLTAEAPSRRSTRAAPEEPPSSPPPLEAHHVLNHRLALLGDLGLFPRAVGAVFAQTFLVLPPTFTETRVSASSPHFCKPPCTHPFVGSSSKSGGTARSACSRRQRVARQSGDQASIEALGHGVEVRRFRHARPIARVLHDRAVRLVPPHADRSRLRPRDQHEAFASIQREADARLAQTKPDVVTAMFPWPGIDGPGPAPARTPRRSAPARRRSRAPWRRSVARVGGVFEPRSSASFRCHSHPSRTAAQHSNGRAPEGAARRPRRKTLKV